MKDRRFWIKGARSSPRNNFQPKNGAVPPSHIARVGYYWTYTATTGEGFRCTAANCCATSGRGSTRIAPPVLTTTTTATTDGSTGSTTVRMTWTTDEDGSDVHEVGTCFLPVRRDRLRVLPGVDSQPAGSGEQAVHLLIRGRRFGKIPLVLISCGVTYFRL